MNKSKCLKEITSSQLEIRYRLHPPAKKKDGKSPAGTKVYRHISNFSKQFKMEYVLTEMGIFVRTYWVCLTE